MLAQIQNGVASAINMVITFVPKLLAFLVVLFIGWLVAKAIQKALNAILERVGFDRLVERGGIRKAMARSKYDASDLLSKIVYYIVMLFVLQLSFGVFGPNPVSTMLNRVVLYLPNVFAAGLIVVIGAAIATAVGEILSAAMSTVSFGKIVSGGVATAILVVTAFAALDQLNIAPMIVTGLFYAILAIFAGVIIVALGGSGIQPMREYWGRFLAGVDRQTPQMTAAMQGAPDRVKMRAQERKEQAQRTMAGAGVGGGGGGGMRQNPAGPTR